MTQLGQCGNQIGNCFWNLALREHSVVNEKGIYDSALSTFFLNGAGDDGSYLPSISGLKARAVLVDMEEGVVGELLRSPIRNIYDHRFLITDVSGSGNNWAVGNYFYGNRYHKELVEVIRKSAELCDCLQCFFLIHSLGGGEWLADKFELTTVVGTGSGIGTHILRILADEYPSVYRIVTAVFPSLDDDVITSPYNTVLSLNGLTQMADCVFPIDNSALANIANRIKAVSKVDTIKTKRSSRSTWSSATGLPLNSTKNPKPFDEMNNIVATMLLNLTR
ncbi:Tubulin epsilon chain [Fasciolopsis buskii]|uniref:Tubulin epsilon chain n=1 Tax=Fasciolopsis buskii TaxID=27845 RepID=A0A8E0RLS1_9TREM|nr:Tubulin epsilon chain [Fasciolopsis buski]